MASYVVAAAIATLRAGSSTPGRLGAQLRLPAGAPAASPERRTPDARGAASGERQPGALMRGSLIDRPASFESCAGHDDSWVAAMTPSDCHPMLTLVPMAT